jgi:hypothetical protein
VLAVLIAGGVGLQHFLGLEPRKQKFQDRQHDDTHD